MTETKFFFFFFGKEETFKFGITMYEIHMVQK